MTSNVFLALGSNIDDRQKYINDAIDLLKSNSDIKIVKISSIYVTKAYGFTEQNDFYNLVCEIQTLLTPEKLLSFCKTCEKVLGRVKREHWGPREIDIDILFYNNLVVNSDVLNIPHKEFEKRDFCVIPMLEIAENFIHPVFNRSIKEISLNLKETFIINKLEN